MFENKTKENRKRKMVAAMAALALALTAGAAVAQEEEEDPEISEKWVRIEINATDGDAGFQGMGDADGWTAMSIWRVDPDKERLYKVKGFGGVAEQGLTENFFESSEPPCDEQPLDDFLLRFPAGEHKFRVKTLEEEVIKGSSFLTHELPGAPENLAPQGGGIDETMPVVISWTAGTTLGNCPAETTILTPPGDVPLWGYEVVVEREDPEPLLIYTVQVPPTQTSVTISPEFIEADAVYKFEVVAIESRLDEEEEEEAGNQTISEAFFCTTGVAPCELPD